MKGQLPNSTRLYHALKAANQLKSRFNGASFPAFSHDEDLHDIVTRQFITIGEVANHVSDELKKQHPDIEWQQVMRFRNFVIHKYFKVDLAIVWYTSTRVVPALIEQLENALLYTQQGETDSRNV